MLPSASLNSKLSGCSSPLRSRLLTVTSLPSSLQQWNDYLRHLRKTKLPIPNSPIKSRIGIAMLHLGLQFCHIHCIKSCFLCCTCNLNGLNDGITVCFTTSKIISFMFAFPLNLPYISFNITLFESNVKHLD